VPLIHSKSNKAFQKNVSTEVEAGKPIKQAVAIAYNVAGKEKRTGEKISKSIREDHPHHSSHIEELGSAYESNSVSGGPSKPYHPAVELSRSMSTSKE
jgi:hypothetical protein